MILDDSTEVLMDDSWWFFVVIWETFGDLGIPKALRNPQTSVSMSLPEIQSGSSLQQGPASQKVQAIFFMGQKGKVVKDEGFYRDSTIK